MENTAGNGKRPQYKDPKNIAIALLVLIALVMGFFLFRGDMPAKGPEKAAEQPTADPLTGAAVEPEAGRVRLTWQPGSAAMAMVRDAATGQLMGFVRTPGGSVVTAGRAVTVQLSDGVRGREIR